jgi:hypothetical protein
MYNIESSTWPRGRSARRTIVEVKQHGRLGNRNFIFSSSHRASEGTLSQSRLYLQLLWLIVGYGSFSLWVGYNKEGLCPSSGDINRLMMMMMMSNVAC